jgi:hypothetical protein
VFTGSVTVTGAVTDVKPLVAVIVALPAATPVTTPAEETVAIVGSLVLQVNVRPVSTLPVASFTVGTRVTVCPWMTVGLAGASVIVTMTVIAEVPDAEPLVAVIVAVPSATAVTTPVAETVATFVALDFHEIGRPVRMLPCASFNTAVNGAVPAIRMLVLIGVTVTDATGARATVTVAVPDLPSLAAVIVALPTPTAVTRPSVETVATDVAFDDQVTVRPVRILPAESFTVAVNGNV